VSKQLWRMGGVAAGLLLCASAAVAQTNAMKVDPCKDTSKMTQGEMNECAGKDMRNAEAKLQRVLKQLGIAPDDPGQQAWEAYRDAQMAAIYKGDPASYGTIYPLCFAMTKKKLTEGRVRDLKTLITAEGDGCAGYRLQAVGRITPGASTAGKTLLVAKKMGCR
jgi:uncharacterized protein YecT (DUF1311 family)